MNNNFKKYAAIATLLVASSSALANDLYIDLNDDAVHGRLDVNRGLDYIFEGVGTEDDGSVFSVGLMKKGPLSNRNMQAGLGAKIMYIDTPAENYHALALGGNFIYQLPRSPKARVTTEVFYAPSITSKNGLENAVDATLRLEYQLFDNGTLYGGLRMLQAKNELDVESDIDNGFHLGFKLSF